MALDADSKHRILREVYRHYLDYYDFFCRTGQEFIEHKGLMISFSDLKYGLDELAPRKREAFAYNVIMDMKQKDVAEIMGITTVSVGQYVDGALLQLAERYFADSHPNTLNQDEEDT